jgi:hypothetical protein
MRKKFRIINSWAHCGERLKDLELHEDSKGAKMRARLSAILIIMAALLSISSCKTQNQELPVLVIDVQIEGLENNDVAQVQLLSDTQETSNTLSFLGITLPPQQVLNGNHQMRVADIPDGSYKLIINAPSDYLRDPGGYLFRVSDKQIVRSSDRILHFRLVPPSSQELPPCRDGDNNQRLCKAEPLVDISAPAKQPVR